MTIEELLDNVKKYITSSKELDKIEEAYAYANQVFLHAKRKNEEPYIDHALRVCKIILDLNGDATTIIATLLHGVLSYENTSLEEVEEKFGSTVAHIIENIYKIDKLELQDESESSAIYLRKVLVGLSEDVRVIIITLADRLDNMCVAWVNDLELEKKKARETEEVLIPIAHRLGINSLKSKLEDACLRFSKPEVYADIEARLKSTRSELEGFIQDMKDSISDILLEHEIKFEIKGRVKSIYSIYKKLSTGRKWNDIYDILALRVFVEKESDCYLVIGLIHSKFRPVPGRFKDYIALPKKNMYQSLHTTVFGLEGHLFEVQVRTYEMDEIAEKGIASHWSYKEKGTKKVQEMMEQKLEMFRNIIEASSASTTDAEFRENFNAEFLSDNIYVFTPKGDVIELPKGATPIDFAYRIHSKVGDHIVGAIVNDGIVPLDYELQDKDIVKINTSPSATPSKEWLNIVKTNQAKGKIKSFFSKKDREIYIAKGEEMMERELRRKKLPNDTLTGENLDKILTALKLTSLEEVYIGIATLRFTASSVLSNLREEKKDTEEIILEKMKRSTTTMQNPSSDILVGDNENIKTTIASCCKPIFGEEIIGYITKGNGITVHKKGCKMLEDEEERLIEVRWNDTISHPYLTDIVIESFDIKNHLLDLLTIASTKNINIDKVNVIEVEDALLYELTIKVKDLQSLRSFMSELEKQSYVKEVKRK